MISRLFAWAGDADELYAAQRQAEEGDTKDEKPMWAETGGNSKTLSRPLLSCRERTFLRAATDRRDAPADKRHSGHRRGLFCIVPHESDAYKLCGRRHPRFTSSGIDFDGRARWEAWSALKGVSAPKARRLFVAAHAAVMSKPEENLRRH